ncbi:MAG: MFS transporter, partial [Actinomycetes bacterium]
MIPCAQFQEKTMSSNLATPKQTAPNKAAIPLSVTVLVALLAFIEFTGGFLQGYYVPLFGLISVQLGISDADITWFSVVSTLAMGVLVPVLSKLGDIYGHRRMLRIATVAVLAGALLVALAPNYPLVLLGRVLSGPLAVWLPLEIALVHNRISGDGARKAIGTLVAFLTIGAIAGTLTAGTVATFVPDTTMVLLIPVALVVVCSIVVFAFVPESDVRAAGKIDVIGFVGLALAMMGLLWGLREAQIAGFGSVESMLPLVAAAVILLGWGWWELRVETPAIDLRMIATRRLWPAYATSFL